LVSIYDEGLDSLQNVKSGAAIITRLIRTGDGNETTNLLTRFRYPTKRVTSYNAEKTPCIGLVEGFFDGK